jgi:hypothetical protein
MSQMLYSAVINGLFAFALMAVISGICACIIRLIVMVLARTQHRRPIVAPQLTVSVQPARDDPAVIAAVIAAAIQATTSQHRVVFLAEVPPSANWISELRSRHHGSHSPHR